MAFSAGTAVVHVVADSAALQASITGGVQNAVSKLGTSLQRTGLTMTKFITAPLVGLGAVATHMALDFEQSFAKIGALAGGIGVPMKQAEEQVKKLAHATGQDPGGLAEALYFVASAGLDAKEVMPVLGASAKAAAAGMGDASTIAQLLTSVLHDYAGTGLDAAKAMNILTGAIKVGKAEPADLAENMGTVIPIASQMKVSFQDVAAAIAQATNAGVDAARATTGLRFLLSAMQNPTEKAKDVFKDYGIAVGKLQEELAKPGGLLKVMQDLAATFDLNTVKGKAAWSTITGGARGAVIANTLVGASAESARRLWDAMGESARSNSTLFEDAFKKMSSTDAFKFQRLLADLKTAAIELGETLIPILVNDIIPAVQKVVRWFKNLDESTRGTIVKVGLMAAAFGPLLAVFGSVIRLAGSVVGKLISIGRAAAGAGAATSAAGGGSGLLGLLTSGPGIAALAAIAGIGGAMLLAADNTRDWNNEVKALQDSFHKTPGAIQAATEKVKDFAAARAEALKDPVGRLSVGFATAHGAGGGDRETRVATEALAKYRQEMTNLVNAQHISNVSTLGWIGNLLRTQEVTKKQAQFLAGAVAGIDRLGGAFRDNERMMVSNLLKVGDFNGALAILDKVAARAAGPLRNLQNAHQAAAEGAADQAQKVRALDRDLKALPKQTNVKVDTQVNTAGLDGLRSKMLSMGFRQSGGGEWMASGAMRVRVIGGSPMPAVQMQQRVREPLERLGFTQRGQQWFMDLFMRFHVEKDAGDAVGALQQRMNALARAATRLGDTISKAVDEAKEKLDEALDKGVGEAAARAAVQTAKAARTVVSALQHMVDVAQRQLDRLVDRFRAFKDSIRSGFDQLKDLAGTIKDLFGRTDENGNPIPVTAADISGAIQTQVQQAQQLAKLLTEAAAKGLSKGLIAQFASQGAEAIPALTELLANPALIEQLNQAAMQIAHAAGETAETLGERYFGRAIKHATTRIDNLSDAIVRAIARIQQALGEVSAGTAAALAAIQAAAQGASSGGGGSNNGTGGGGGPNMGNQWDTGWNHVLRGTTPPINPNRSAVEVHVHGDVLSEGQLVRKIDEGLAKSRKSNGILALDPA